MPLTYEAGIYLAEVSDVGMDFDQDGKQPVIKVKARVLSRQLENGDWEPCSQQFERTVWLNCSVKAKKYVMLKLRHAGWHGSAFNNLRGDLLAQNVRFVNKPETALSGKYEGELVERWDMELPPKGESFDAKPEAVNKLNSMFAEALADIPNGNGHQPVPLVPPTAEELAALPAEDSEVPF